MSDAHGDDYKKLMAQKRFLDEIEQGIRIANREVIHARLPKITKADIHAFAVAAGRLRAGYLEAAFRLGHIGQGKAPDEHQINELKRTREMYEEARDAFEALRYAIERGYVDIEMDAP